MKEPQSLWFHHLTRDCLLYLNCIWIQFTQQICKVSSLMFNSLNVVFCFLGRSCSAVFLNFYIDVNTNFCMFRRCVHLPVCQDSPGAQAGRVWQGHPPSSRKPKRKSRHNFCQRRRYQVRPGNSHKTLLWGLEKQDQSRQQTETCGNIAVSVQVCQTTV